VRQVVPRVRSYNSAQGILLPQAQERERLPLIQLGTTGTSCLWQNESKTFQTCPMLMFCPFTFFPFHSDASFFCFHYGPSTFLLTDSTQRAIVCTFTFSRTQGGRKMLLIVFIHFIVTTQHFPKTQLKWPSTIQNNHEEMLYVGVCS
jgi:hypothetical protein